MEQLGRKEKNPQKEADKILAKIQELKARRDELSEELQEIQHSTTSSDDAIDTTSIQGNILFISQEIESQENRLENLGLQSNFKSSQVSLHDTIKIKCVYADGFEDISIQKIVESKPNHLSDEISKDSPLGKALIGHSIGETITVLVPDKSGQIVNTYTATILEKV